LPPIAACRPRTSRWCRRASCRLSTRASALLRGKNHQG
jgi:hypothetical protein